MQKKYLKSYLLRHHMLYESEALQTYSSYKLLQFCVVFLCENYLFHLVAMATYISIDL